MMHSHAMSLSLNRCGGLLVLLCGVLCMGWTAQAQIATGTWRDHPNFTRCKDVAVSSDLALVAAETAVFALVLDDEGRPTGETQRFGKAEGLSRADISIVALADQLGLAIVAYTEGTFDLVRIDSDGALGDVLPVTDLSEADLLGSKEPHRLVVEGERLLLCTDIGVVEYDLIALEVRDTWKLESAGEALPVRSVAKGGGQWWAATGSGLWSAPLDSPFPGNPATWTEAGLPGADLIDLLALEGGGLVCAERREGPDAVWRRDPSGNWSEASAGLEEEWRRLAADGDRFWASSPFGLVQWEADGQAGPVRSEAGNVFFQPMGIAADAGAAWLANAHSGVLRLDAVGDSFDGPLAPNGPKSNACIRLDAWNEWLWVASGGTNAAGVPLYRQEGFSGRKGTWWRQIAPPAGEAGGEGVQDPMEVSINPLNPEVAVFGSLEEGLIEVSGNAVTKFWNPNNSPLAWNTNWNVDRCAVPALDFDRQGNLWLANEGTESPLKMLDAEGEWHVFSLEGLGTATRFTRVLATQSGQVWIALGDGQGVAVLATGDTPNDPSDDDFRILGQGEGQGGLPSPFVYALEEDLDGEVWVGTLQGPAVFYQPSGLFEIDPIDAQQILIEQDGNFQFLLETETILDIALDGGNRKWLATVNSGVFLLSPDGREEVTHFTSAQSPLPSNEVYDVAIDQSSGLVYFATPNGITSYRGTATNFVSELGNSELTVFPNPWRPGDPPNITIDGLAFGSEVHIVDAAGRLVRRLDGAGGRVFWDMMDVQGQPVPEGVYFALAGESGGNSGGSGKMVILR